MVYTLDMHINSKNVGKSIVLYWGKDTVLATEVDIQVAASRERLDCPLCSVQSTCIIHWHIRRCVCPFAMINGYTDASGCAYIFHTGVRSHFGVVLPTFICQLLHSRYKPVSCYMLQ